MVPFPLILLVSLHTTWYLLMKYVHTHFSNDPFNFYLFIYAIVIGSHFISSSPLAFFSLCHYLYISIPLFMLLVLFRFGFILKQVLKAIFKLLQKFMKQFCMILWGCFGGFCSFVELNAHAIVSLKRKLHMFSNITLFKFRNRNTMQSISIFSTVKSF